MLAHRIGAVEEPVLQGAVGRLARGFEDRAVATEQPAMIAAADALARRPARIRARCRDAGNATRGGRSPRSCRETRPDPRRGCAAAAAPCPIRSPGSPAARSAADIRRTASPARPGSIPHPPPAARDGSRRCRRELRNGALSDMGPLLSGVRICPAHWAPVNHHRGNGGIRLRLSFAPRYNSHPHRILHQLTFDLARICYRHGILEF